MERPGAFSQVSRKISLSICLYTHFNSFFKNSIYKKVIKRTNIYKMTSLFLSWRLEKVRQVAPFHTTQKIKLTQEILLFI